MIRLWSSRSRREKVLAVTVAVLLVSGTLYTAGAKAGAGIGDLDERIETLGLELINYARLDARSQSVEKAFAEIAMQHSSAWTAEEIHDRLRQEVLRLASRDPAMTPSRDGSVGEDHLIEIPVLNQGAMREEEGYREYRIEFEASPTELFNVVVFLRRLIESPQALRVDAIDLRRGPYETEVVPRFQVARTVIDWPAEGLVKTPEGSMAGMGPNLARNPGFESWDQATGQPEEWETEGCRLSSAVEHVSEGEVCLRAEAAAPEGVVFQRHNLKAGKTYALQIDVAAQGQAEVGVVYESTGEWFKGVRKLNADQRAYRYPIQFTIPENAEGTTALRAPCIRFAGVGGIIYMDNVTILEVPE